MNATILFFVKIDPPQPILRRFTCFIYVRRKHTRIFTYVENIPALIEISCICFILEYTLTLKVVSSMCYNDYIVKDK
jgi:hypothetical protein